MSAKKKESPAPARRRGTPTPQAAPEQPSEWGALEKQITKDRGEGIVLTANTMPRANHIPTGAFTLDFALLGGLPEGHAFMFYGLESSGKTTMTLKAVAAYQRKHPDKLVVWVDTESMFDRDWAVQLGCDLSRIKLIQPQTGEEAVDLIAAAMEVWEVGKVILDSVPACVPQAVVDRSAEDKTMGVLAALMGLLCSKILMTWNKERRRGHKVTVGIINQWRTKVGFVMGDNRTLPGGRQINHLPTTKVEIKNKEVMGEDRYGNEVVDVNDHSFKISKAKHGASIRNGEFQMVINPDKDPDLGQGDFDDYRTVVVFAKKFGLLTGSGGKYRLPLFTEESFAKFEDIQQAFKLDAPLYQHVQAALIAGQRIIKGLDPLPPDGYLVGPGVTVPVHALMEMFSAESPEGGEDGE